MSPGRSVRACRPSSRTEFRVPRPVLAWQGGGSNRKGMRVTSGIVDDLNLPDGVTASPALLLMLGRESDPSSERGTDCPGELPPSSDPTLVARARAAKDKLGSRVFILGHHYQRDE